MRHTAVSTRQSSGARWRIALVSNFMAAGVSGGADVLVVPYCCKRNLQWLKTQLAFRVSLITGKFGE